MALESAHILSEVGLGDYNRRDNTGWEKNFHIRGQRLWQGDSVQAAESRGGVRTSVSTLRKCQSQKASKRADWMWFPAERVPKLSINWGWEASYLRFTFHFITKCGSINTQLFRLSAHEMRVHHITDRKSPLFSFSYHVSFLPLGVLSRTLQNVLNKTEPSGQLSCEFHILSFLQRGTVVLWRRLSFLMLSTTLPAERSCPSPPFTLWLIRRGPRAAGCDWQELVTRGY